MRVVLDTNIVVSGLLSPTGPPGRIVDLMTAGSIVPLYDDRILSEYRDVLAQPRLKIAPADAETVLEFIEAEGILIPAPPFAIAIPDSDDLPFLEVTVAGVAVLITGNERHFVPTSGSHDARVLSPAAFLSFWLGRQG